MKKFTSLALILGVLLGSTGCMSVAQGKSTFTVQCQSIIGIGCGFEDAEDAIPSGGKVTNVNHSASFLGLFKTSTIGGTK